MSREDEELKSRSPRGKSRNVEYETWVLNAGSGFREELRVCKKVFPRAIFHCYWGPLS